MPKPDITVISDLTDFGKALAKLGAEFDHADNNPVGVPNHASDLCNDLTELADFAKDGLFHMIQNLGESRPQIHFLSRSGTISALILASMPQSRKQQAIIASGLCILLKHAKIDAVSIAVEMWIARETRGRESGLLPSQREDRQEGIFVSATTRTAHRIILHELVRGPAGGVTGLVPGPVNDDTYHFRGMNPLLGNLFTLFDDPAADIGDASGPGVRSTKH